MWFVDNVSMRIVDAFRVLNLLPTKLVSLTMRFLKASFFALVALLSTPILSQFEHIPLTDPTTGIVFQSWKPSEHVTFGLALPRDALSVDAGEFIGYLSCTSSKWCGISLGGGMLSSLLLLAYPSGSQVLTSFRWATDYTLPVVYTGDAKLTQISSKVNSTAEDDYEIIFRCKNCLKWVQKGEEGTAGAVSTREGFLVLGWVRGLQEVGYEGERKCADEVLVGQHEKQGIFGAELDGGVVKEGKWEEWVGLDEGREVKGDCGEIKICRKRYEGRD
ncbi:hypothetical protein QBC38DRAFT_36308 [Podospora fimiseda]|uniref:Cellobiose dehydrogenase-like cytochrome domain-containing protein n=1 Tax=Podospora fimiseda TaxID=252190 RepID=A0AAN7BIH7_9PEZI|nr:hypothetical protein QBC38DRAFT_36308 [Podospora fimiseda]